MWLQVNLRRHHPGGSKLAVSVSVDSVGEAGTGLQEPHCLKGMGTMKGSQRRGSLGGGEGEGNGASSTKEAEHVLWIEPLAGQGRGQP